MVGVRAASLPPSLRRAKQVRQQHTGWTAAWWEEETHVVLVANNKVGASKKERTSY